MIFNLFLCLFIIIMCGCSTNNEIEINVQPIDAQLSTKGSSRILTGPSVFQLNDHFVWGGSPIKGQDGRFYMIYSAFEKDVYKFTTAWISGSKLGLAVSDYPDHDFKSLGFVYNKDGYSPDISSWDAQCAHNPHIKRFNNKYYLYHIGTSDPQNVNFKSSVDSIDRRSRLQQSQCIGVIEFDSFQQLLDGKFKQSKCILKPRTRVKSDYIVNPSPEGTVPKPDNIIVVNPSVVYRPYDKKYLLYFKGNIYDPSWRGVHGVAIGNSPTGPFVAQNYEVFSLELTNGQKTCAEDPYVWYNKRRKEFYAVFKDFNGAFTQEGPSLAWMHSKDGINWELMPTPLFMKKELTLKSGETIKVNRLERPQLLLDKNDDPFVLFCACSVDDINFKTDGSSFNIQIPLK